MNAKILLVLGSIAGLAPVASAAPEPGALASAWRDLQTGVNRADVPTLVRAKDEFSALSEADPALAALHRAVALASWRAVVLIRGEKQAAEALALLKDGLSHCETALGADARDAEALALKGSLQALELGYEPAQTMLLGPESRENLDQAAELAPRNPRVKLLSAVYTMHAPQFFGGGADKALPQFEAAVALFEADAPGDSTAPAWGRDDALLWAGQAAERLGRAKDAAERYRQALQVNPENGWARQLLQRASAGTPGEKQ